nr:MAG TPA: hypothetical protein [Caudoviricetes sp.]
MQSQLTSYPACIILPPCKNLGFAVSALTSPLLNHLRVYLCRLLSIFLYLFRFPYFSI